MPPPPTAATDMAGSAPAAAATDHKITLRAVEAGPAPAPSVATSVATPDALPEQVAPTGAPALAPTTSSVTATPQTHPASPAEQVAPALLTLAKTADGGLQMTVRLQPADLGMVQVRIAQAVSGTTQIDITAENPATLLALQRDQPQLHRTLDEAGIPAAGRTVTFHVAEAAQAAAGNQPGAGHAGSHQGSANRNSSTATDADGSAAGGRGSYRASERNAYPTARRRAAPPATAGPQAATTAPSYRIGLDITA
jgi:flagellar hook-length control protein FliK